MIRLFDQHKIRRQKELDGIWKFVKEDGSEYDLPVPGCWEQHPELLTYRGKGTFYKKVYVREKTNIRLEFKGVSHTADVYFDDAFVVHHYNAFTGFCGIVKNVEAGEHVIKVEVDNTFGEHSALHTPNDYYTYGGMIRPVVFEEIGDVYIQNVHFKPYKQVEKWFAEITVTVENLGEEAKNVEVEVSLEDVTFVGQADMEANSSKIISWNQEFPNVKEWNSETPNLYYLKSCLKTENGKILDDYIERIGFREVSLKGYRLLLNGKPVFLKGFNRHEDYGTLGSALPLQVMVQDMDMMQEVGSNAVRTCHYPNDERFLDLCDERGMLVWEENHARGFGLERMQNPNFEKQCEDCIAEMIAQHYNHPAIVIWGILNECASETPEGREMYQKQYEQIKALDTSRPTTSATCRHFSDICLDLPDIVSFNMYSGWYQDVSVKERHEKEMDWIASAGGEGKPVIVSEFGAAAIYGYRDRGRCKWSEERQADLIRENLEVYREDPRLTGVFIWQFADCKVTEEEWFATRARCHNNKGVVDEYRRPKEAYDVVKELFPTLMGV
ncbi:MAG: beta-glucuronidase [Lachnospiraceae bacterium]|nr:beta-glucuronidase [Lachnospiraceae bacterium]